MLACGHDKEPFGDPICTHLRECQAPALSYFRRYTGTGMAAELLCKSCEFERQSGRPAAADYVCKECFRYAVGEVGELDGVRGKPAIRVRLTAIDEQLQRSIFPAAAGNIVDVSPIETEGRSIWLTLSENGTIGRFSADSGEWTRLASASVDPERDREPWCGRTLKRRLHAAPGGDFAAVVNDYGRYGQLIDLRTGQVTLALDGGDYHVETVPFSFAFGRIRNRLVAIHRTDWNRLDVSDPADGTSLTERGPTSYGSGEECPTHYLDYFHGTLHVSPSSHRIADDGWVWHPVGVATAWELETWTTSNVWEAEDGPTRKVVCARDYYWDHAMTWLDDDRIVVGGIGDDDDHMIDGARVFDLSLTGEGDQRWRADWSYPRELVAFVGPAGVFFGVGNILFSADSTGLSRWDANDGSLTGCIHGFSPTHRHRGARELVQIVDDALVRWTIDAGESSERVAAGAMPQRS